MASKFLTSRQLEKQSNENIISSYLALQKNILIQQHDFLEQNKEINQKLLDITSRFDLLVNQNEKFSSKVAISKNMSKFFQKAFQKTTGKMVKLERNQHRLEQYLRRECLEFSGISNTAGLDKQRMWICDIYKIKNFPNCHIFFNKYAHKQIFSVF